MEYPDAVHLASKLIHLGVDRLLIPQPLRGITDVFSYDVESTIPSDIFAFHRAVGKKAII